MNNKAADARHAICNLLYRYAEAVDDGDMETLNELFRHAVLYAGSEDAPYPGSEGVEKMFGDFTKYYDRNEKRVDFPKERGTPYTIHVISNPIIEVSADGKSARGRSRFVVFQAMSDFPMQPIIGGRYRDEFAEVDGEWRFVSRMYKTNLVGDISHHLPQPPPVDR